MEKLASRISPDKTHVSISIYVKPSAKDNKIVGLHGNELAISLQAKSADDAANEALIKLLSDEFSITKSHIIITSGLPSRHKVVKLPLTDSVKDFVNTLS